MKVEPETAIRGAAYQLVLKVWHAALGCVFRGEKADSLSSFCLTPRAAYAFDGVSGAAGDVLTYDCLALHRGRPLAKTGF